jgi:hypothetical protein
MRSQYAILGSQVFVPQQQLLIHQPVAYAIHAQLLFFIRSPSSQVELLNFLALRHEPAPLGMAARAFFPSR